MSTNVRQVVPKYQRNDIGTICKHVSHTWSYSWSTGLKPHACADRYYILYATQSGIVTQHSDTQVLLKCNHKVHTPASLETIIANGWWNMNVADCFIFTVLWYNSIFVFLSVVCKTIWTSRFCRQLTMRLRRPLTMRGDPQYGMASDISLDNAITSRTGIWTSILAVQCCCHASCTCVPVCTNWNQFWCGYGFDATRHRYFHARCGTAKSDKFGFERVLPDILSFASKRLAEDDKLLVCCEVRANNICEHSPKSFPLLWEAKIFWYSYIPTSDCGRNYTHILHGFLFLLISRGFQSQNFGIVLLDACTMIVLVQSRQVQRITSASNCNALLICDWAHTFLEDDIPNIVGSYKFK